MRESQLVKKIVAAVRAKYPRAYVRKLADRFTRGLPDILIVVKCLDGQTFSGTLFVETKAKGGRLSPIQAREHVAIMEAGVTLIVATDVETVLEQLEDMGAIL